MKKQIRTALAIFFYIIITIFLVLGLLGFVPSLSADCTGILAIIFIGILTVQVLKSASRIHEDEKKDKRTG